MQGHDLFAETQTDAGAGGLGGEERNENLVEHLRQDATTIVLHRKLEDVLLDLIGSLDNDFWMGLSILSILC